MDLFLLTGAIIILGFIGARAADRVRAPWVVGYIIVGVVLGSSGFRLLGAQELGRLEVVSLFALALIGFTIGGELDVRDLRTLGRSIVTITLFEALGAFFLVFFTLLAITGEAALALLFGALASATAPAATVDVLWQYRSRGPVTTTLFGVVGLDDATALIIYAFASSIARSLLGSTGFSITGGVLEPLAEIGGSILLGGLVGLLLNYVLRYLREESHAFIVTIGAIALCAGLANTEGLSLILTCMSLGFALINLSRTNRAVLSQVASVTPVIFLVFFVLVGAQLRVGMLASIGVIGIAYIVMRVIGKTAGTYVGARISDAPETVRKYLALGLLSQAGVAVGLALDASHTFGAYGAEGARLGSLAITVIAATTFVYQVAGPPLTKLAIFKAGEVPEEYAGGSRKRG